MSSYNNANGKHKGEASLGNKIEEVFDNLDAYRQSNMAQYVISLISKYRNPKFPNRINFDSHLRLKPTLPGP
jgi:hypothetical protein